MIAGLRQYEEIQDELFKWIYLPYPEAIAGMKKANAKMRELFRSGQEIMPLASLLLPAISAAKVAEARSHILAAVIGLIVVFLSYFIITLILSVFGLSLSSLKISPITPQ